MQKSKVITIALLLNIMCFCSLSAMSNTEKTWNFKLQFTQRFFIDTIHTSKSKKSKGHRKWINLFDGSSTSHWRGYKKDYLPSEWKIEDGTLTLTKKGGGYILTKEQYENFELKLEWKISEGGNSGVLFHVSENPKYKYVYETGPEVQILDDERHPDAKKGSEGTHKAGANYDLMRPLVTSVKAAGQWNKFRLKVKNGHVQHWLNGKKLQDYQLGNTEWQQLVSKSKFASMPDYGKIASGYIVLQDHGDRVWFKNIKIRNL